MSTHWLQKAEAIHLSTYNYILSDEQIAKYPLPERDQSKLLVYTDGAILHETFANLASFIPAETLLVFNDTRVIPARAHFTKSTGAVIEVLLLHPEEPTRIINDAMLATQSCVWACMVGNKKRWKIADSLVSNLTINDQTVQLTIRYADYDENLIGFSWNSDDVFLDVVKALGQIPLPPYLHRNSEESDKITYQTVYAKQDGAVAAPTAGLHFTTHVFDSLARNAISCEYVTLHVGAGTFQPVKVDSVTEHKMHSEQVVFSRSLIESLRNKSDKIVPVGTTSLRSLESLFWFGVKLLHDVKATFHIEKLYPYPFFEKGLPLVSESLLAILTHMNENGLEEIVGETEIFIFPGYQFQLCKGLITNFHQPGSTLILLVAALIGENWKTLYQEAQSQGYRFLSYGDSSLLWGDK